MPERMANGELWPKISIVTPSYNQGQFIEETIRSVLLQNYPNLEYIIIDGGSTDNSVGIIRKYEPWLTYWVSEKDKGQSDALNKGFNKAKGKIQGYLNSDDIYFPDAFKQVALAFARSGEGIDWLIMPVELSGDINPYVILPFSPAQKKEWLKGKYMIYQPGIFWTDDIYNMIGKFDIRYHYSFDAKFFIDAFFLGFRPTITTGFVAARFRCHMSSKGGIEGKKKTRQSNFFRERRQISKEYAKKMSSKDRNEVLKHWLQLAMDEALAEAQQISNPWNRALNFALVGLLYPYCCLTRFYWGVLLESLTGKQLTKFK